MFTMSAGVPTRSWMPRSCDTDESSQSGIGDTELPSPISFKKSKGILINQEECAALTAARDVCVYSRRLDPSKFPCAPWNQQFYVNRYLNTDNYASLPRSWSKHLSKDPFALRDIHHRYAPANPFLFAQARKRDPSLCQCVHYLPSKVNNNCGFFCIDFFCGCPHSKGGFGPIPDSHNASQAQLAALGRSLGNGVRIDPKMIRQSGGLYCPRSMKFYLCPSRSLRRFALNGPIRKRCRRFGSRLPLTDTKYSKRKKLDYLTLKEQKALIGDNDATTDTDSENEPLVPRPATSTKLPNDDNSEDDEDSEDPFTHRVRPEDPPDPNLTFI